MQPSIINKLNLLNTRHQEISNLLSDPEIINNQNRYRELSKEYSHLEPIVNALNEYNDNQQKIADAETMIQEEQDADLKALAEEELFHLRNNIQELVVNLQSLLLPCDPNDECNVFLEIRAGAGGDEAAIFAGELFRMYHYYAQAQGWSVEALSSSPGEHGGYKEIIARIAGRGVYSRL